MALENVGSFGYLIYKMYRVLEKPNLALKKRGPSIFFNPKGPNGPCNFWLMKQSQLPSKFGEGHIMLGPNIQMALENVDSFGYLIYKMYEKNQT